MRVRTSFGYPVLIATLSLAVGCSGKRDPGYHRVSNGYQVVVLH